MAQNVLARTFELRCRNFPDFHVYYYGCYLYSTKCSWIIIGFGSSVPEVEGSNDNEVKDLQNN